MGREVEGGVVALQEFSQYKLFEPYGQSRKLNVHGVDTTKHNESPI